jgi:hypothetical protein
MRCQGSWITCSLRVPYFHPDSISLRLEMSHGRRAVRYQCPSRDDESNDCGESEGQCGPYQEPQGFGKVPERLLVHVEY